MIVVCPGCGRRYRLPETGPAEAGRRVRCSACRRVFAAAEGITEPAARAAPAPAGAGSPSPRAESPPAHTSAAAPRAAAGRGAPLVLVGDEDREFRQLVRRTLESLGCKVEVTDDGEAAFRYAVARHPDLIVLNVYLQRLLGVAVCEGIKGSPDLRGTKVVLVGSVFKSDRFVRNPGNLYGADDYFEDVISEAQLRARLHALLSAAPGTPRAPVAARQPTSRQAPLPGGPGSERSFGSGRSAPPAAGPLAPNGADEPIDPRSEIRRLARIMVSDLKIYHPDGFLRAILERRFSETFREELTQAKDLIGRRFPGISDRMAVLTEALKEQLAEERAAASRRSPGAAP